MFEFSYKAISPHGTHTLYTTQSKEKQGVISFWRKAIPPHSHMSYHPTVMTEGGNSEKLSSTL